MNFVPYDRFTATDKAEQLDEARRRLRAKERGALKIKIAEPTAADRAWHGQAPRLVPETDKNWRPRSFSF